MDRRTLIAVVLCLVIFLAYPFLLKFFGLDRYLRPAPGPAVDSTAVATPGSPERPVPTDTGTAAVTAPPATPPSALPESFASASTAREVVLETPLYRARFTTHGARLLEVQLKHYAAAHGRDVEGKRPSHKAGEVLPEAERVDLAGEPAFGIDLGSGSERRALDAVAYDVAESLDAAGTVRTLTFTARDSAGARVRQTYRVRPGDYAIDLEVEIRDVPIEWRVADYTLTTRSWPLTHESNLQDEEHSLKATSMVGTNLHREAVNSLQKGPRRFEGNAAWAAVQTRYFSGAVALTEGTARSAEAAATTRTLDSRLREHLGPDAKAVQQVAVSSLIVSLPGGSSPVNRFVLYFGPNEYFRLARLGHGLERLVDLGWSWITPFSRLLLQLMIWLHGLLRNYGVAIVVLATLVRVLLHPLSMMSIKSMRAMQKVQPEIERLRAKYAKDAQAMNTAIMALYKEHKINPAGGCLPMLVQMPLFIALYSVLFNAIELRQAPFVAWMTDLSAPDVLFRVAGFPIRLLPLLMAGSGFIQQKVTPTDPRQASTYYFMNLIMVVFFYNLPSGLVLYWTVMNLLTALQQWIALHEDGAAPALASQVTGRGGTK